MFISYFISEISNMYTPIPNNFYKLKKNHTDILNAAAEAQDHVPASFMGVSDPLPLSNPLAVLSDLRDRRCTAAKEIS